MEHQYQKPPFWQSIAQKFVENFSNNFMANIRLRIETTMRRITQKILASFILLLGFLFLLVSIAMLLNDILDTSPGVGYGIVGIIIVIFGFIINANSKK